jgi:hypothetical protein
LTDEVQHSVRALASLPDPLRDAFEVLADTEQEQLYRLSIKMIRGLQQSGALPVSRMCLRCRFFDPYRHIGAAAPHHCHSLETALAERQLRIDCAAFAAADKASQAALWDRFIAAEEIAATEADSVEEIEMATVSI